MSLVVDVLCSDGSPLGVSSRTVWGDAWRVGVGGAELALITMCEEWHKAGYTVTLFNSPHENDASPFYQLPKQAFEPKKPRDIVIAFRSPNPKVIVANGLKVWWSTDQYTIGSFRDFAPFMDKIVCISDFHADYFKATYGITDSVVIDLPVRVDDFKDVDVEKVTNRFIFTSVPDRGLQYLHSIWPRIKVEVPDASLVITSDYRLWGTNAPMNEKHRQMWISKEGVIFLGAVNRAQLVQELLRAEILAYPNSYDELFCISVAEAQVAGVYPITSGVGALQTTNMGSVIPGHPKDRGFMDWLFSTVVEKLDNGEIEKQTRGIQKKAITRFKPETILKQWDKKVFT